MREDFKPGDVVRLGAQEGIYVDHNGVMSRQILDAAVVIDAAYLERYGRQRISGWRVSLNVPGGGKTVTIPLEDDELDH